MESKAAGSLVRAIFGGDLMLGRYVGEQILRHGSSYPLAAIASLLRDADLSVANLECAITASRRKWSGAPKAFYFGAPPAAIETLCGAGIDMLSLANNHLLDFDVAGLRDTLRSLDAHAIAHAGAGATLAQARQPAVVVRGGMSFGMAAFCDHQPDFAAASAQPGIAHLDLHDEARAFVCLRDALEDLQRRKVDWPILSLHWGANMVVRPPPRFRRLAHAAIDMGWKILFGHSAHVFQGIELYRGRPVIYAAGDLVDDYMVDPDLRNDLQFLFELELEGDCVRAIVLHPLLIEDCRVRTVSAADAGWQLARMRALCAELGTQSELEDGRLRVPVSGNLRCDGVP